MINNNFLSLALTGNSEAAFLAIEACFAQEQPVLVVPKEEQPKEVAEYRKLFKTLESAFEPDNRKEAISLLKRDFASQTSETGALARIMLVFFKLNDQAKTPVIEVYPTCLKRLFLYKKAISEAEAIIKPKMVEALKKDSENYIHTVLWEQALVLDELSLLPDPFYTPVKEKRSDAYQKYLLSIISFYSGELTEEMFACTPHELTRIAIESLKERTEAFNLQGTHNKDLFATFWLATLYMRQDFYEFTDLPEANYLLYYLEKNTPLNSPLYAWVQAKRVEMTLLDASNFIEFNNPDTQAVQKRELEKKEAAKKTVRAYAANTQNSPILQGLANVRLALFMIHNHIKDSLTLLVALKRSLALLNPASYLIPLINYHLGKLFLFGDQGINPDLDEAEKYLKQAQKSSIFAISCAAERFAHVKTSLIWEKNKPLPFSANEIAERYWAIDLLGLFIKPYYFMSLYHALYPTLFQGKNLQKVKEFLKEKNVEVQVPDHEFIFPEGADCDLFLKEKLEAKDKELCLIKECVVNSRGQELFELEKLSSFSALLKAFVNEYVVDLSEAYKERIKGKQYFRYETLNKNNQYTTLKLTYHIKELMRDILGDTKDESAHPGLVKSYLQNLQLLVNKIYKSSNLALNWISEKQVSRKLNVPYYVSAHILMQGIRELINTLEDYVRIPEIKEFLTKGLVHSFKNLINTHMCKYREVKSFQEHKEINPYLINASKYNANLISKVYCSYPSAATKALYESYVMITNLIPEKYQFELFFDVAKFLKKAHFCAYSEIGFVDHEWAGALEFNLRALEVANQEEALLIYKEIYELSPQKKEDFTALYKNYLHYLKKHSKSKYSSCIALFFVVNIQYRRFIGKEQEAEELRKLIDEIDEIDEKTLPFKMKTFLNENLTIIFRTPNYSHLPSETERERHILETLGPSYPPFKESILQITTPKKRGAKPNQKKADSNQIKLELSTQPCKSNPKTKFQPHAIVSTTEPELQQSYLEQNVPSTTTQVKEDAKHQILKNEGKLAKKRAKQSKAATPNTPSAAPPVQSVPQHIPSYIFLKPRKMDIFDKFFEPKTSCAHDVMQGDFDAYSFRNDVKISLHETAKLVKALGGTYVPAQAKGSHTKATILSLDCNDHIVLGGKKMTLVDLSLNHNAPSETVSEHHSETLTLPKSQEDCLKFYMIQQIREKLLSLNLSPKTVKRQ